MILDGNKISLEIKNEIKELVLKRFKERFGSEVREYNYHCFVSSDTIKQKESNELLNAYPFFFIRSF